MSRTAVVLFNLGGPDSKEAIEPFLFNFFMDPNIIALPRPFRWLLAKLISKKRSKREAGESYGELGNASPPLANTQAQADALQDALGVDYKTFVCMRYWHPMAPEVAEKVKAWDPDRVVILPLYPQFSTTTTWSSLGVWNKAYRGKDQSVICCYPFNEGFIEASAENVKNIYEQALNEGHEKPRILFSAHGLPESVIKKGDPYQWQCEGTAEKIVKALEEKTGDKNIDWAICYQSKVGPMEWIGPSLDEELKRAAQDKKPVIIYPHAFTQEHVETLVELDIEYKEMAHELGLPGYYRAATVDTHPAFIEGLAQMVRAHSGTKSVKAENMKRLCPQRFKRCCMRT